MALPYILSFSPFAILTAQEMNEMVANDAALQNGSAFDTSTDTSTFGGAWQSWTPTLTNLTLGSGTVTAAYQKVGKTIRCRIRFVLGSGSAVGSNSSFSLPVNANAAYSFTHTPIGLLIAVDTGTNDFMGIARLESASTVRPILFNAAGSIAAIAGVTSTVPFTWTSTDEMILTFEYESI